MGTSWLQPSERLARCLRALRREDGIALAMAVVFTAITTTVSVSVFYFVALNQKASARQRAAVSVRGLAEAGINNASSVVGSASDPTVPTLLAAQTTAFTNGSATWSGTYDSVNKLWNVTSTGRATYRLQGNGEITRTLTARIPLIPTLTQTTPLPSWNTVYATGSSAGCDLEIKNSVVISAPTYVIGDLCLYNTAKITGGTVNVTGRTYLTQPQNSIGTSTAKIPAMHSVNGCQLQSKPVHIPCDVADQVYALQSDTTLNPSTLAAPVVDWDYWYRTASPGPMSPCRTGSGTPPTFDVGTPRVRDANIVATQNLAPSTASYTCQTKYGELSWNHVTKVLTVSGAVFIDGSATIDSIGAMTYVGQGALFLSGQFSVNGTRLCAVLSGGSGCSFASWNPNTTYLAVATNARYFGSPTTYGVVFTASSFQGGLYSTSSVDLGQTSDLDGGVIAAHVVLGQTTNISAANVVPSGLAGTTLTTWRAADTNTFGG